MGGERRQVQAGSVSGFRLRRCQISHNRGTRVTSPGPDRQDPGSGATVAPPLECFSQGVSSAPRAAQLGGRSSAFGPPTHTPPSAPAPLAVAPPLGPTGLVGPGTSWGRSGISGAQSPDISRGTHSDTLCRLTWDLFQLCSCLGTELIPRHIPGKRNICSLPGGPSRPDRMDPRWNVGCSHGRSVRHQVEQVTSPMLLSPPGRRSLGSGQHVSLLGGPHGLCVSPHSSHPCGLEQGSQLPGQVVPDCALLAQPGMVSSPVGVPNGSPTQAPGMGSSAVAPDREGLSADPRFLQASRLETIGYFLRERGFSADVTKKMSRPQSPSSETGVGNTNFFPVSHSTPVPRLLEFPFL
jgi:hypothetical protein